MIAFSKNCILHCMEARQPFTIQRVETMDGFAERAPHKYIGTLNAKPWSIDPEPEVGVWMLLTYLAHRVDYDHVAVTYSFIAPERTHIVGKPMYEYKDFNLLGFEKVEEA